MENLNWIYFSWLVLSLLNVSATFFIPKMKFVIPPRLSRWKSFAEAMSYLAIIVFGIMLFPVLATWDDKFLYVLLHVLLAMTVRAVYYALGFKVLSPHKVYTFFARYYVRTTVIGVIYEGETEFKCVLENYPDIRDLDYDSRLYVKIKGCYIDRLSVVEVELAE